jgi:DNA polymerase III alpha subunit
MKSSKIVRIKSLGKMPVMDIEVASKDHIFYANGIATSNSHAVSYAINSYWSAYRKVYQNKEFFVAYLSYSGDKQDPHQEVYELVSEAKLFDISVKTPNISNYRADFYNKDSVIYFGIKNVKSLTGVNGDKTIDCIEKFKVDIQKDIKDVSWLDILIYLSNSINSASFKTLASIGFFRGIKDKITRNQCIYDYEIFKILTDTEYKWVVENYPKKKWKNLIECFTDLAPTKKEGGGTFKEARKQVILNEIMMLKNPPYELEDDTDWIIDQEVKYLGCPVSMSKIESSEATGNTTCKEILDGKQGKNLRIAANITRINNFKIKKEGKNKDKDMSFLTIEDETAALDSVVIFPDAREEAKYDLFEGNNVMVCGNCEKGDSSFVVEKIYGI